MILIPQPQEIDGESKELTITADVVYSMNGGQSETTPKSVTFNRELKGGRRYYIQLNFLPGDLQILIVESDEWDDSGRIDHDFE